MQRGLRAVFLFGLVCFQRVRLSIYCGGRNGGRPSFATYAAASLGFAEGLTTLLEPAVPILEGVDGLEGPAGLVLKAPPAIGLVFEEGAKPPPVTSVLV